MWSKFGKWLRKIVDRFWPETPEANPPPPQARVDTCWCRRVIFNDLTELRFHAESRFDLPRVRGNVLLIKDGRHSRCKQEECKF